MKTVFIMHNKSFFFSSPFVTSNKKPNSHIV